MRTGSRSGQEVRMESRKVQYNVTGMGCAACQARVEKAVSALPGVEEAAVSLLTNSMCVTGNVSPDEVIAAVTEAGYGASVAESASAADEPAKDEASENAKKN